MAEEVWESTLQGDKSHGAYGPRDVLPIVSSERLEGPDIVPRRRGELSAEDKQSLSSQGIPPESWESDEKLMEERCHRDNKYYLLPKGTKDVLTRQYVMERIHAVMNNTTKPGVILHYIGPGKRDTGDWCFPDGFIEFRELIDAYMEYFHSESKYLFIVSNCSYSYKWVIACREFLDEVGVQPCGHSARRANMLLKVRAFCKSHKISHTLARGICTDKNLGVPYLRPDRYEVEQTQHISNIDSTVVTCRNGASIDDPCSLPVSYTWDKERAFLMLLSIIF